MRLFLAIELPDDARRYLEPVHDALRTPECAAAMAWVKRENWHVTLKFLGDVEDARLPELLDALGRVPMEPMRCFADHLVCFPPRGAALREEQLPQHWPGPTFAANGFVLMQSTLDSKGAIYAPAAHFPLNFGDANA